MPSRILVPRIKANVRWSENTQSYEMYCPDCAAGWNPGACFWPLTDEFWYKDRLQRCITCYKRKRANYAREKRGEALRASRERLVRVHQASP